MHKTHDITYTVLCTYIMIYSFHFTRQCRLRQAKLSFHACGPNLTIRAVLGRQNTSSEQPPAQYGRR